MLNPMRHLRTCARMELELGMRAGVVDECSNVAGALRLPSPRGLTQTTVASESVHRLQEEPTHSFAAAVTVAASAGAVFSLARKLLAIFGGSGPAEEAEIRFSDLYVDVTLQLSEHVDHS